MTPLIPGRHFTLTVAIATLAAAAAVTTTYSQPRNFPRPDPRSPDQRLEWRLRTDDPVRHVLVATDGRRVLATVNDYFSHQDHALAVRHAQRVNVYWNDRSDFVAFDEFDYRRAGDLHLFWIRNGQAKPIRVEALIKRPPDAVEARFCVQNGWDSPTRLSIRLAAKLRSGEVVSKPYVVNVDDPLHPTAAAGQ